MAPRPLLLVSASGDWTTATPTEVFPAIQSIYRLLGADTNVENVHLDYPHNYNKDSREAVYKFFNTRLLNNTAPCTGADIQSRVSARSSGAFRARAAGQCDQRSRPVRRESDSRCPRHDDAPQPRDAATLATAHDGLHRTARRSRCWHAGPKPATCVAEKKESRADGRAPDDWPRRQGRSRSGGVDGAVKDQSQNPADTGRSSRRHRVGAEVPARQNPSEPRRRS